MSAGRLSPAVMVTHVGGLDSAAQTIKDLPSIPGGKKLIYTQVRMPLTALDSLEERGRAEPFYANLACMVKAHNGLWSAEAERYVLRNAPRMEP
jgi:hypothetical protein